MKTVFIQIATQYKDINPLAGAIGSIVELVGGVVAEQLVVGDVEADIAVTNNVSDALRLVKETVSTKIVLTWFHQSEKAASEAFAARYPDRVTTISYISRSDDNERFVPYLMSLVASSAEEE